MKNKLYVIIIVLCLVVAVWIFIRSRSHGGAGYEIFAGESIYIKCDNPECGAVYQMDQKDYFKQREEKTQANRVPGMRPTVPPITCRECGKEAAFRAVKCEKCEHVFFYGARKGTGPGFADRCPKCGFSKDEEDRRTAAEAHQRSKK